MDTTAVEYAIQTIWEAVEFLRSTIYTSVGVAAALLGDEIDD